MQETGLQRIKEYITECKKWSMGQIKLFKTVLVLKWYMLNIITNVEYDYMKMSTSMQIELFVFDWNTWKHLNMYTWISSNLFKK